MEHLVSVLVLNYRQAGYVPHCLDSLHRQTYPWLEIIFVDNHSQDGAVDLVQLNYPAIHVIANPENQFYSRAHNQAIRAAHGAYVMPMNVDIRLTENYIAEMVKAIELRPEIGMVSGKLLQMDRSLRPLDPPVIDSTGLWFTREMRHFDRGSHEIDRGQYEKIEYIFGPSGAAPLYRRAMLEDIAFQGEYFDEDFVIYREDADLAWRAQLLGWKAIYTPFAIGYHVRSVRPTDDRKTISALVNMHSVKNRFLMRLKNQTWGSLAATFLPALWRDFLVIGYVLLVEHQSLPAFVQFGRLFPKMLRKRRAHLERRRVGDSYIARWFSEQPASIPWTAQEVQSNT